MKKIKVKLCCGTLCYVMGGAELQALPDMLPDDLKDKVEFSSTTCLDYCNDYEDENPPFVEIDGDYMAEASPGKVLDKVRTLVRKELNVGQ